MLYTTIESTCEINLWKKKFVLRLTNKFYRYFVYKVLIKSVLVKTILQLTSTSTCVFSSWTLSSVSLFSVFIRADLSCLSTSFMFLICSSSSSILSVRSSIWSCNWVSDASRRFTWKKNNSILSKVMAEVTRRFAGYHPPNLRKC